jgi:hypothetical protein
MVYSGDNNKQLVIQQVNTNKVPDIITNSSTKVKLADGTEAYVKGSLSNEKSFVQIIFAKGGMNYTVAGQNLGEGKLLSIANDLK